MPCCREAQFLRRSPHPVLLLLGIILGRGSRHRVVKRFVQANFHTSATPSPFAIRSMSPLMPLQLLPCVLTSHPCSLSDILQSVIIGEVDYTCPLLEDQYRTEVLRKALLELGSQFLTIWTTHANGLPVLPRSLPAGSIRFIDV